MFARQCDDDNFIVLRVDIDETQSLQLSNSYVTQDENKKSGLRRAWDWTSKAPWISIHVGDFNIRMDKTAGYREYNLIGLPFVDGHRDHKSAIDHVWAQKEINGLTTSYLDKIPADATLTGSHKGSGFHNGCHGHHAITFRSNVVKICEPTPISATTCRPLRGALCLMDTSAHRVNLII